MRVLMLGWEFPPFIAGGLGTACHGLTRALNAIGQDILFVLPRPIGDGTSEHVTLMGPDAVAEVVANPSPPTKPRPRADAGAGPDPAPADGIAPSPVSGLAPTGPLSSWIRRESRVVPTEGAGRTRMLEIGASFRSPYGDGGAVGGEQGSAYGSFVESLAGDLGEATPEGRRAAGRGVSRGGPGSGSWLEGLASGRAEDLHEVIGSIRAMSADSNQYGTDLIGDADRYARIVAALAMKTDFDVVHAHDWLTYPAGLAVKALTGKPLVCHMHATEFDRSGEHINQAVYDIERAGVHGADRVIAVSQLTRTILVHRYGATPSKIDVSTTALRRRPSSRTASKIEKDDKIVLFLGRITMQKGPEYFIRAAKRVLEKIDNVKFVVAGSGDMAVRMIEEAAALGIGHKVLFTGFLRGKDVSASSAWRTATSCPA
jgi:glycosyltransferase involved in cell wall biosynthesis